MSLYDILKTKNDHFVFRYFPIRDLSYNGNLNAIFNEIDEIKTYFTNYTFIINEEHLKDFLICYEWAKYNKDKRYISKDYTAKFSIIMNTINSTLKKFNKNDVLSFIENNEIISSLDWDLKRILYDFLVVNKKHLTKNLLSIYTKELNYFFINDIDDWSDVIINNNVYGDLLSNFEELSKFNLEKILKFIEILKEKGIDISFYINKLNAIMNECLKTDIEKALVAQIKYNLILSSYKLMNLPEANEYESKKHIIENNEKTWLQKYGNEIRTDLQINNAINQIKRIQHPGLQILHYTHEASETSSQQTLVSFYEAAKNLSLKDKPIFLEMCSSSQPYTKRYDTWLQECYVITEILHLNILSYVYNTEELKQKYFEGMQVFMTSVLKKFENRESILKQFQTVLSKIEKCIILEEENNIQLKDCCKSCVDFIEYLARELYYEINKKKKYIDKDKLTIGFMFNTDNKLYDSMISNDFLDGVRFYLSSETTDRGERVGMDLRNRMNHANRMLDEEYNRTLFIRICLILTTFINELYLTVKLK